MNYCCDTFRDAVDEGLFLEAELQHEANWYMAEGPHIYFCPFCGTDISKAMKACSPKSCATGKAAGELPEGID